MCKIIISREKKHMSTKVLEDLPRYCDRFTHICLSGLGFDEHERKCIEELDDEIFRFFETCKHILLQKMSPDLL
jgi:hypothetical protein